jgi:hypothetical protein
MDDLVGLNFSAPPQPLSAPLSHQTRQAQNNVNYISPIPSRHLSPAYNTAIGQLNSVIKGSTPPASSSTPPAKPDSFAFLSSFAGVTRQAPLSNLSLEQQRLVREKEKKEALEAQKRNFESHFGDNEFWEMQSRQGTPSSFQPNTYSIL